jgi:hypothetical protein
VVFSWYSCNPGSAPEIQHVPYTIDISLLCLFNGV